MPDSPELAPTPDEGDAVHVSGLRKAFGEQVALDGLSFRAAAGSILGLLGPNGAGKTTTVNVLSTLLRPDAGSVRVAGHDALRDPAAVRREIGLTGQYAAVDADLTGRESLTMFARLLGRGRHDARRRADELLEAFDLLDAADRRVKGYSGGMRRRLDLAVSLVGRPRVLFLDEPTTGLDPRSRMALWEVVRRLRADGVAIVLTTQYLEEADALADRLVVIDHGRAIADGTPDELKARVGGRFCEAVPVDPARTRELASLLAGLGAEPEAVSDDGPVRCPAAGGAGVVGEVVAIAERAGIELRDVGLRQPTLDDVFLALTGSHAPGEGDGDGTGPREVAA